MPTEPIIADDPTVLAWEDSPRAALGDVAPVLSIDGFEGPIDWLLEMVRAQKIDLARLSIGALVDAFAGLMEGALDRSSGMSVELSRWGDWLVMAATLTHLRSRLILPLDAPEAQQARHEAEALRQLLVDRARISAGADWLERRPQLGRDLFARGRTEATPSGRVGDIADLLRACLVALRVPEDQEAAYRPRPAPFWTVGDAVARIERLLPVLPEGSELAAFLPSIPGTATGRELQCRATVASAVMACLELARNERLGLDQQRSWTVIRLTRSNH